MLQTECYDQVNEYLFDASEIAILLSTKIASDVENVVYLLTDCDVKTPLGMEMDLEKKLK